MASNSSTRPPNPKNREASGDTATNPTGVSSKKPAEGADDASPKRPGSPEA